MNRIYRLVFNRSKGQIQVTSERGSARGKASSAAGTGGVQSARRKKPSLTPLAAAITLALALPLLPVVSAQAATKTLSSSTGSSGTSGTNANGSNWSAQLAYHGQFGSGTHMNTANLKAVYRW